MITVSAPGKLFIAGEWAILELGNAGIVTAVNKRVSAEVSPLAGKYISVHIDDFRIKDLRFSWDGQALKLFPNYKVDEDLIKFTRVSIETALRFLQEKSIPFKPFKIRTKGEDTKVQVDGKAVKLGFGSSAASTVAVVKAILDFHGYPATKDEVFKLATIAHYFVQGKAGSGFDVAASTYGGVFMYKRFDGDWLVRKVEEGKSLAKIVADTWPRLEVEPLQVPPGMFLDIGWTRAPASTVNLVKQVNEWAKSNRSAARASYTSIGRLMMELLPAWRAKKPVRIVELLRKNEDLLRELGQKAGVEIETQDLRTLSEQANRAGGAGKLSGAGGGDCGIAVSFSPEVSKKIRQSWTEAGFPIIDAAIDPQGVLSQQAPD
ncbi:MAG: phosphomevalonate kinase [Candidatus Aenigmarchaeota archaeon]|nr:phosphomevalonate kinase [Candidatus Aenigmarchaeota archaeon]